LKNARKNNPRTAARAAAHSAKTQIQESRRAAPVNVGRKLRLGGAQSMKSKHFTGSDLLQYVSFKAGTDCNAIGASLLAMPLNPRNLTLTRLARESFLWQRYKVHRFCVRFKPTLPTTSGGSVIAFFNTDCTQLPNTSSESAVSAAMSHKGAEQSSVWEEIVCELPSDPKLYQLNVGQGDPRTQFFAILNVMISTTISPTSSLSAGSVIYQAWVEYDIEFIDPTLDLLPGEDHNATLFSCGYNGSPITSIPTLVPVPYQLFVARICTNGGGDAPVGGVYYGAQDQSASGGTQGNILFFGDLASALAYQTTAQSQNNALIFTGSSSVTFTIEVFGLGIRTVAQSLPDGVTTRRDDQGDQIVLEGTGSDGNPSATSFPVFLDQQSKIPSSDEAGTGETRIFFDGAAATGGTSLATDSASNIVSGGQELVLMPSSAFLLEKWGFPTPKGSQPGSKSIILGLFALFTLIGRLVTITASATSAMRASVRAFRKDNVADPVVLSYEPPPSEIAFVKMNFYDKMAAIDVTWKYVIKPSIDENIRAKVLEFVGSPGQEELNLVETFRNRVGAPYRARPVLADSRGASSVTKTVHLDKLSAIFAEFDVTELDALVALLGSKPSKSNLKLPSIASRLL